MNYKNIVERLARDHVNGQGCTGDFDYAVQDMIRQWDEKYNPKKEVPGNVELEALDLSDALSKAIADFHEKVPMMIACPLCGNGAGLKIIDGIEMGYWNEKSDHEITVTYECLSCGYLGVPEEIVKRQAVSSEAGEGENNGKKR